MSFREVPLKQFIMNIGNYIQLIRIELIQTHAEVLDWFSLEPKYLHFRPSDKGWTITEILEHISLTSKFLLLLIDKGSKKAMNNVKDLNLEEEMKTFDYNLERLNEIQDPAAFIWTRPDHMVSRGKLSEFEIKAIFIDQLRQCLNHLDDLKNGEGLLYKTMMSVNDLGKLNVYEYIYFLVLHAKRHIVQMKENVIEYNSTL